MVFVDDLAVPALGEGDAKHLSKSLRVRPGARVVAGDGDGGWRWTTMTDGLDLEPDGEVVTADAARSQLTIAFAVVKGDRSDLVVQKATELGIQRIIPIHTARSVVRWDEAKSSKNNQRHKRIAREAAMQSRNLWLPEVAAAMDLNALVSLVPDALFAEPGGPRLSSLSAPSCVVVGPEGGFDPSELQDRATVGLPGNILRAETAAIAAAVLLRNQVG